MKTIAVLVAFCFVGALGALTEEQKAKLNAYKTACLSETGVDAAAVEEAKKGNIPEGDEKLACFSACMLKKIGIMNPDGTVNVEVARAKIPAGYPQEKAEEIITRCKDRSGANECETGKNLLKCFMENNNIPILQ